MIRVIAHRGASRAKRENTVEAFLEARRMGADMVELDVHLTADGAIAVFHDASIPEVGLIASSTVADLPDWVPLLDAAVDACEGMGVNIEIKAVPGDADAETAPALVDKVVALITERDLARRVVVSSFSMATIDAVRSADPVIPTAWLTGPQWDQHRAVGQAAERGHAGLHPHHASVTEDLIAAAHGAGLFLNTWTCDDPDRMRQMAGWGIDGICTNVPDLALAALRRSGQR